MREKSQSRLKPRLRLLVVQVGVRRRSSYLTYNTSNANASRAVASLDRAGISRHGTTGISEHHLHHSLSDPMGPHRTDTIDRTSSKASPTPPESNSTRKHTSKACEHCRKRRTKCVGGIPCEACKKASLEGVCEVRTKARPQRYAAEG
jgi:hypothetical protein